MCIQCVWVNWFDGSHFWIDVPLWLVLLLNLIFILIVIILAALIQSRNIYACPNCGHNFRAKWYKLMFSMHEGSKQCLKCPECGKKDFCTKKDRYN